MGSRLPMLPSQSSRASPPTEPSPSTDQSELTRPSASQLFTRPEPTPSRPSAKLSTPQSTLLARSQLLPSLLPQLLPLSDTLLPQLLLLDMLPPQLLLVPMLLTELMLLPQLLLPKLNNPAATISKYLSKVIGLCPWCTVSPPPLPPTSSRWTWWLLILSCWNRSNVLVMLLQYDITYSNIKTSGTSFVVMLNVLFVRYR